MSKILLVEDDGQIRALLKRILEKQNHSVQEAPHGREALALLASELPDLVITDMFMPEMDGLEFIEQMLARHPGLPFVAISGEGGLDAEVFLRIARYRGAHGILQKPFGVFELQAALERVLKMSSDLKSSQPQEQPLPQMISP
ncbi:MAG: response regulator [Opitutae bacterium]|nr:response regulator [Opitutae bacterium]